MRCWSSPHAIHNSPARSPIPTWKGIQKQQCPMKESQAKNADILWLDNKTPSNFHAKKSRRQLYTIAQRAQHYSKSRREQRVREQLDVVELSASNACDAIGKCQQAVLVSLLSLQAERKIPSARKVIEFGMDRSSFTYPPILSASHLDHARRASS